MLHEVAAGDLAPGDIVNPLLRILRHVNVIEADVQDVDLDTRKVRVVHGFEHAELELDFDHLLLALGSETNFFDNAGIRDWAVTMKNLTDAAAPAKSHGRVFGRSDAGARCSRAP